MDTTSTQGRNRLSPRLVKCCSFASHKPEQQQLFFNQVCAGSHTRSPLEFLVNFSHETAIHRPASSQHGSNVAGLIGDPATPRQVGGGRDAVALHIRRAFRRARVAVHARDTKIASAHLVLPAQPSAHRSIGASLREPDQSQFSDRASRPETGSSGPTRTRGVRRFQRDTSRRGSRAHRLRSHEFASPTARSAAPARRTRPRRSASGNRRRIRREPRTRGSGGCPCRLERTRPTRNGGSAYECSRTVRSPRYPNVSSRRARRPTSATTRSSPASDRTAARAESTE